ncbi:MAG: hypothetical protein P8I99_13380 [Acidimicrobiales bacterium]|nr:hypothetical protein [Acidimicrobiales bacterium]MDG1878391.1 hypothetical protein [Acidimicrobiales bacterium]
MWCRGQEGLLEGRYLLQGRRLLQERPWVVIDRLVLHQLVLGRFVVFQLVLGRFVLLKLVVELRIVEFVNLDVLQLVIGLSCLFVVTDFPGLNTRSLD